MEQNGRQALKGSAYGEVAKGKNCFNFQLHFVLNSLLCVLKTYYITGYSFKVKRINVTLGIVRFHPSRSIANYFLLQVFGAHPDA